MAKGVKTIHVGPETELSPLLEDAMTAPVILERQGVYYRLETCGKVARSEEYDPSAVIATLDALAGSISEIEAEDQIRKLYAARQIGSRPPSRP